MQVPAAAGDMNEKGSCEISTPPGFRVRETDAAFMVGDVKSTSSWWLVKFDPMFGF